jgi:aryl-alcohol dehydrogenase-like predicted oxidoreductase
MSVKISKYPFNSVCRLVMGTSFWRELTESEASELFDAYVKFGGNCLDTSLVYNGNIISLGTWMKSRRNREQIVIHAKGAHHKTIRPNGVPFEYHRPRVTPEEIKSDLDETLRQLQTDYVDVYTLHRDDPDQSVSSIVECLAAEQKTGRIRAFGASNWIIPRIEEANAYAAAHGLPGFALSSPNLALAFPNEPSWPNCVTACDHFSRAWYQKTETPLFAWSCLALGFFSGNYRPMDQLSDDEFEKLMSDRWTADVVRVYYSTRNFERLARAKKLAEKLGVSTTQLALAWVLHQGKQVFAVAGPRTTTEIKQLFEAVEIKLTPDQLTWLNLES